MSVLWLQVLPRWYPSLLLDVDQELTSNIFVTHSLMKTPQHSPTSLKVPDLAYKKVGEVYYYPLYDVLKWSLGSSEIGLYGGYTEVKRIIPDYQMQDLPGELLQQMEHSNGAFANQQDSLKEGVFQRKFPEFNEAKAKCAKMKSLLCKAVSNFIHVLICLLNHNYCGDFCISIVSTL